MTLPIKGCPSCYGIDFFKSPISYDLSKTIDKYVNNNTCEDICMLSNEGAGNKMIATMKKVYALKLYQLEQLFYQSVF